MTENLNKHIKISIIVPCYKVEKYLPRCLDSLVEQTLNDIEIICINDGSPDNCLRILKDYQSWYPDKIVIIDKENEGVWRGRMDGIRIAHGEFIGFVDSDDYVDATFAEKLYNAAVNNDADISCCGFDRIDLETGSLYSREMTRFKYDVIDIRETPGRMVEVNAAPWNKIYKAELLKRMHKQKYIPKILDDMVFLQLIYINARRIAFIKDSLVYYMVRKDSIINTVKQEQVAGVYSAMNEVRKLYERKNPEMLEYINACAFLHLGVSFMYRLSENKEIDFNHALKRNTAYLNKVFPGWQSNEYITILFMKNNRGANMKIWMVRQFYRFHIFKLFLVTYKFMINKIGVDIKW